MSPRWSHAGLRRQGKLPSRSSLLQGGTQFGFCTLKPQQNLILTTDGSAVMVSSGALITQVSAFVRPLSRPYSASPASLVSSSTSAQGRCSRQSTATFPQPLVAFEGPFTGLACSSFAINKSLNRPLRLESRRRPSLKRFATPSPRSFSCLQPSS